MESKKEVHDLLSLTRDRIIAHQSTPRVVDDAGNLKQWVRNGCSLFATSTMAIPATIISYPPRRFVTFLQVKKTHQPLHAVASELLPKANYKVWSYLWYKLTLTSALAPLFKSCFLGPMLIAKDLSQQTDCRHPTLTYFSGAFSTVILQTTVDFNRRMKELNKPQTKLKFLHYWRADNLHVKLPPFAAYMFVANVSSLIFFDLSYEYLTKRYPNTNAWQVGAMASLLSLPFAKAISAPVDTWATRIMSASKEKKISRTLMLAIIACSTLQKVLENGFLLTTSYALKDHLIHWICSSPLVKTNPDEDVPEVMIKLTTIPNKSPAPQPKFISNLLLPTKHWIHNHHTPNLFITNAQTHYHSTHTHPRTVDPFQIPPHKDKIVSKIN